MFANERFIPTIGVCLFILAIQAASAADHWEKQGDQLDRIHEQLGVAEKELQRIEARKTQISSDMQKMDQRHAAIDASMQLLMASLAEHEALTQEKKDQARTLQEKVLQHHASLGAVARYAYRMGSHQWLYLVLNENKPEEMLRSLTYYGYIQRAFNTQLSDLSQEIKGISDQLHAIEEETDHLQALKTALADDRQRLKQLRRETSTLLSRVEHEHYGKDSEIHQLRDSEHRLESLLSSVKSVVNGRSHDRNRQSAFGELRHRLSWPVSGDLVESFGAPRMSSQWDGVVIAAPEGAEVKAVHAGRVAYADWLQGYGLLTILDHGDGYMTLYAFNLEVMRRKGDQVKAGDAIARVGASGGRDDPGLYFGIRRHGKPLDPSEWCN